MARDKSLVEAAAIIAKVGVREIRARLAQDFGMFFARKHSNFKWGLWNEACGVLDEVHKQQFPEQYR